MARIGTYNIPDQYRNDTFDGLVFSLKNSIDETPIDLTGASIKVQFRHNTSRNFVIKELNIGTGITILDAAGGRLAFDTFIVDWQASNYVYDIEVTFADGRIKTYVKGSWKIIQDITY